MSKSLLDLAYEFISKQNEPQDFNTIWENVVKTSGLSEEEANKKVGRFYTNLLLDGRFVTLGENKWDLRSRNTYDKVIHIDIKSLYAEESSTDKDPEEENDDTSEKEFDGEPNDNSELDENDDSNNREGDYPNFDDGI